MCLEGQTEVTAWKPEQCSMLYKGPESFRRFPTFFKKNNRFGCYYMALRPSEAYINNANLPCHSTACRHSMVLVTLLMWVISFQINYYFPPNLSLYLFPQWLNDQRLTSH